jgi:ribosomal 50S subunit-associated protein YjgA (DUF615 family)
MYQDYLNWLIEHGESQSNMSFRGWLESTYPGNISLHNQIIVAEYAAGNLSKAQVGSAVTDATNGVDADLQAALAALARNRLSKIANTMAFIDKVEDRLMRRVNIEEASIDQLLGVGRLLRGSLKDDVTIVGEVVKSRSGVPVEQPNTFNFNYTEQTLNVGDAAARLTLNSRDSRDRSRIILDSMVETVKRVANEPSGPSKSSS